MAAAAPGGAFGLGRHEQLGHLRLEDFVDGAVEGLLGQGRILLEDLSRPGSPRSDASCWPLSALDSGSTHQGAPEGNGHSPPPPASCRTIRTQLSPLDKFPSAPSKCIRVSVTDPSRLRMMSPSLADRGFLITWSRFARSRLVTVWGIPRDSKIRHSCKRSLVHARVPWAGPPRRERRWSIQPSLQNSGQAAEALHH